MAPVETVEGEWWLRTSESRVSSVWSIDVLLFCRTAGGGLPLVGCAGDTIGVRAVPRRLAVGVDESTGFAADMFGAPLRFFGGEVDDAEPAPDALDLAEANDMLKQRLAMLADERRARQGFGQQGKEPKRKARRVNLSFGLPVSRTA